MEISKIWKNYNEISMHLSNELGRSNNLIGEYGERLINEYLNGTLLKLSHKSADIEKDGKLYQVKCRRLDSGTSTQLGVIRSWDFHYLAVIIFNDYGIVQRAQIVPVPVAREISVKNDHQNGYVITTNKNFFNCRRFKDITLEIKILNGEDVSKTAEILPIKTRTFTKLHKIKKWAMSPENRNHRIIKAYLKLNSTTDVKKEELLELCGNSALEPNLYVEKFNQHFNSMKTDAGNSHGKIFLEDNGFVYIYPQAVEEIKRWF